LPTTKWKGVSLQSFCYDGHRSCLREKWQSGVTSLPNACSIWMASFLFKDNHKDLPSAHSGSQENAQWKPLAVWRMLKSRHQSVTDRNTMPVINLEPCA
jgi:hypothetical protein